MCPSESLREALRRYGVGSRSRTTDSGGAGGDGVEVVRARYGLDHRYGRWALGEALEAVARGPHLHGLGPGVARGGRDDLGAGRTVWLDTETTGLAGGTGTYAFLVGLAYVEGDALVVEQLLLRRLSAEGRLLAELRDRLAPGAHLVTFNGLRFDWPILEARFILSRQDPPFPAHTDLVRPARWLWHRVLGTHRLAALESEVLAAPRGEDVPGWQIPSLYVQYLRTDDRAALDPVLRHNRSDLLAMVALHGQVVCALRDPETSGTVLDWEGAGVLLARLGEHARAAACFERALAEAHDPRVRWRTLRRLTRQYQRVGETDRCRWRWEDEALRWTAADRYRVQVLEEVAKLRERAGDLAGAQQAASAALRLCRSLQVPELVSVTDRLHRRVVRLGERHR